MVILSSRLWVSPLGPCDNQAVNSKHRMDQADLFVRLQECLSTLVPGSCLTVDRSVLRDGVPQSVVALQCEPPNTDTRNGMLNLSSKPGRIARFHLHGRVVSLDSAFRCAQDTCLSSW